MHRIYTICTNWELIHVEIQHLKCTLLKNNYPISFINKSINLFLEKLFVKKQKVVSVPKREFIICLPFLGSQSRIVSTKLKKLFSSVFPAYKIKFIIKPGMKLANLFSFKDKLSHKCLSNVVYKFSCSDCNVTYIGKTTRHLKVRMCEHLGVSHITGKVRKFHPDQDTAIRKHLRESGHNSNMDNFKIISRAKYNFDLTIKESILIGREKPILNKQVKTFQLALF